VDRIRIKFNGGKSLQISRGETTCPGTVTRRQTTAQVEFVNEFIVDWCAVTLPSPIADSESSAKVLNRDSDALEFSPPNTVASCAVTLPILLKQNRRTIPTSTGTVTRSRFSPPSAVAFGIMRGDPAETAETDSSKRSCTGTVTRSLFQYRRYCLRTDAR